MIEVPWAAKRYDALVRRVLSVPHEEIMRREAAYQRQSAKNPHRRGPNPKRREKHAECLVRRPDGSHETRKVIGWLWFVQLLVFGAKMDWH